MIYRTAAAKILSNTAQVMSLLRDIKLVSHDRIFCCAINVLTLLKFRHVARHRVNVCDIILSE